MALDVETLLAPISEEQPAGEDLAYDNDRALLEQTFETASDGLDGEAAPERDWRGTIKLIESQFARSKDIWLAVYLARAGAESGDLVTVETGLQALAGLFERFWPVVHPQLEELGLPGRKAPCDALANRKSFLGPLERTILIAHPRLGRYSGADLERFRSEGSSADGYGLFRAALDELGPDSLLEALERLDSIEEALRRADKIFTSEAGGEPSPSFSPTYAALASIKQAARAFLPGEDSAGEEAGDGGDGATGGGGGGGGGGPSVSGAVNSRDDVVRVLGLIGDYYRKREPSHPMPLLIERAQQWVTMDFFTLMKDIAPDGVDQAERILKQRRGIFDE